MSSHKQKFTTRLASLAGALTPPVFPTRAIPALLIGLALLPALIYLFVSVSAARQMAVAINIRLMIVQTALIAGMGLAIGLLLMRLLHKHVLVPLERARAANLEMSLHDPLTDLPNRRLLLDRIGQAMSSSARSRKWGALLFVDLDHFKNIGKTLGHDIGDLVLQQVALRLRSSMRECDTVARLSGDKFVIVLEDLSEQFDEATSQTKIVGGKALQSLKQPYRHMLYECNCTASMGVTIFKGHQLMAEKLLKQSEMALYQAKQEGRNTLHVFASDLQE